MGYSGWAHRQGAKTFFSKKIRVAKTFFPKKIRGRRLLFRRKLGGWRLFFDLKKGYFYLKMYGIFSVLFTPGRPADDVFHFKLKKKYLRNNYDIPGDLLRCKSCHLFSRKCRKMFYGKNTWTNRFQAKDKDKDWCIIFFIRTTLYEHRGSKSPKIKNKLRTITCSGVTSVGALWTISLSAD